MRITNIAQPMAYRPAGERALGVGELYEIYPIRPLGTLTYYGLVEDNVCFFNRTHAALQPKHRVVIDGLLGALYDGYANRLVFQLVVEPTKPPHPYSYALEQIPLLRCLAIELARYQSEASTLGKQLDVIVRFGSEMNDVGGTSYTCHPAEFIAAFRAVRECFAPAPSVLFPFSPALRADIELAKIEQYWPGDEYVDLVGATWYVHGESQRDEAFGKLRDYCIDHLRKRKPFSLDEFGGSEGWGETYLDNDLMLRKMLEHIASLSNDDVHFEYGTIFLDESKYGRDATLGFLLPAR